MKRIYVAGASAEIGLVMEIMRSLRETGWTITYDWTAAVAKHGSQGAALSEEDRHIYADLDVTGVEAAAVVWLLVPSAKGSAGAWVELGYALRARDGRSGGDDNMTVVVSGSDACIFTLLADKRFAAHEEALAYLVTQ